MSATKLLFTVLATILTIIPITMFKKNVYKILYQCYVAILTVVLLASKIYMHFIRKNFVLPQKVIFTILCISQLFLDVNITIILCKHSRVLLKLIKFLTNTWSSKCVVIWMLISAIHSVLVLCLVKTNWYSVVGVYSFLRLNSTLIGLILIFHLTKTRVKQFNQDILKSTVLELQTLLQDQKKLFALIDCLNHLFGVLIFWAVLTAIFLAFDYVCFMMDSTNHYKTDFLYHLGYYIAVVYFEVSDKKECSAKE